ncbi:MAG: hypothetical protein AAB676_18410, partial [Verrucomicrobiota bacterium]
WDGIFLGTSPITTNNLAAAQDNLFFATGGATSGTYIPEPAANELLISTAITVGTNNTLTAVASSSPASVTGTGNLTINGGVTAGQGILLAQTRNRPGDKITINNSITSNSNTITISAEKDVDTTLVGVLTTTGKAITVTGDRDATGAGRVDLRGNVTSNGGNITITGTGVAQLSGIINSGNATVTIDGNSTASAGSRGIINLVGTIQTTSTSPSALVIRDAASVNLAGTITLSDSVSGTLKIGGTDADAITNDVTQNSGIITVAANTIITAGTSVDLNQAGNDFNTFTATGTTSVRVKDVNSIALDLITAVTTVTVTSGGSVTDNNGATANIIAASLTITAVTGIDTDTTITTLASASVTGTGSININDTTGGLVVTNVQTNNGAITLNATGGDLDISTLTAGNSGTVTLTTTTSGKIRVDAVITAGGSASLNAADTIEELTNDVGPDITATTLSLTAVNGIGQATGNGALEIDVTTLASATVSTPGLINVSDTSGGMTVTSASTNSGAITFNATSGNLILTSVIAGGAGTVTLTTTTSGDILLNSVSTGGDAQISAVGSILEAGANPGDATADLTAATATLTAANGIGEATGVGNGALEVDLTTLTSASVTSAGRINLIDTAGGMAVTSAITANGDVTLTAQSGTLAVTALTAGNGGAVSLTTTTSGDIEIHNVTTTGTATLNSAGAIKELSNDAGADLTAASASLTAATGIGEATGSGNGVLDVDLTTLTLATVTGTGLINLNDTAGGLTVTNANTTNGAISINATSGNLILTSVSAGTAGAANLTTTTSGNISVGSVTTTGTATFNSLGNINETTNDTAAKISAATVSLTAATGLGTTSTLDLSAVTLSLASVTGTGSIDLRDTTGGLAVTNVTTTNGNIAVTASGSGSVLAVTGATAGTGGNITFTADEINLGPTVDTIVGTGTLTLQGESTAINLEVAGSLSDNTTVALDLTTTDVAAIKNGFNSIVIGRTNGTGTVIVNLVSFKDAVVFQRQAGVGAVTFKGNLSADGSITVNANVVIDDTLPIVINSALSGGDITINGTIVGVVGTSAESLELIAGTGNIVITGDIGNGASATDLETLTITSATNSTFSGTINLATALLQTAGSGMSTFNGTITAGRVDLTASTSININSGLTANGIGDVVSTGGTGSITLTADEIDLNGGTNSVTSTGTNKRIVLQPLTASRSIAIGGTLASVAFDLTVAEIAAIKNGFSTITIGRSNGSGEVTIDAITFNDPVTVQTPTGSITVNGQITGADDATITLNAAGSTTLKAGIVTSGRAITINGAVVIGEGFAITIDTGAGSGSITITGNTNGTADGLPESLTFNTGSGILNVSGLFGAGGAASSTGLTTVTVTNAGITNFNGAIAITGALTQTNAATGATTFASTVAVGSATLRGTTYSVTNSFAATGAVSVTNSGTFTKVATGAINANGGFSITGNASLA